MFHKDWTINVTCIVLTSKTATQPGGHIFQQTETIFKLSLAIIRTKVLTKVLRSKTAPPLAATRDIIETNTSRVLTNPGGHVFQQTGTIFKLSLDIIRTYIGLQNIIGTNLLTKFYEDQTINVASSVNKAKSRCAQVRFVSKSIISFGCPNLYRKNAQPPDIIGTNLLTKFHDDRTIKVASSVMPPWRLYIIWTNLLNKFHDDQTINVASRVKNAPLPGAHFHEDQTINVTTRVLTRKIAMPPWWPYIIFKKSSASRILTRKNALPPGSHVFQPNGISFELVKDIIGMNLLTMFHEDRTINVASRVFKRFYYSHIKPYFHVFQTNVTIFKLIQDIIETNRLTKFHDDQTINVASKVKCPAPWRPYIIGKNFLTKFHENQTINVASRENAPTPKCHVVQPTGTIFKFVKDIIGMNLLTMFHEDQTMNAASRVLTRFYYSHIRINAPPLGSHVFQANVP
ncbi:hypothetical protein DPMN_134690 [Dreissena polymorpha]|uniref:Uncharacterized protein n=1 Tax=Dreissena polymorpha TaxID=45954 RepID=A0A9D4G0K0_DREPO|nr:hypothetical protein DPMN_134690 [Dreissena polymorpha]